MHISSDYAEILWETNWVGQKQKTERERRGEERERLNDGNNNGQATHGARKAPGPTFLLIGRLSKLIGQQIHPWGRKLHDNKL